MWTPVRLHFFFGARLRLVVPLILAVGTACVPGGPGPHEHQHGCVLHSYNSEWSGVDLRLTHTDTRNCPLQTTGPGEVLQTAGHVIEDGPEPFDPGHSERAWLTVRNDDFDIVAETDNWFDWDIVGVGWEWVSYLTTSFESGTGSYSGRDWADFEVEWVDWSQFPSVTYPWARVILSYSGCMDPECM